MIFTVILLYPCLLLESLVNCASVEFGVPQHHHHQISPIGRKNVDLSNRNSSSSISSARIENSFNSSNSNSSRISNEGNIKTSPSAASATLNYHENRQRRLKTRQVSPSEWLFSTLIQPSSASPNEQEAQNNGGGEPLAYRSIGASSIPPSNYYTNYYRNHNIYSQQQQQQTGRRVDGTERDNNGKNHLVEKGKQNGQLLESSSHHPHSAGGHPEEGLSRRRESSLPSTYQQHLYANSGRNAAAAADTDVHQHSASATSNMPEAISSPPNFGETTGLSKTAPATDPSTLSGTERSTSTQEMQIEEGDTVVVDYGPRAEIGGRGKKGRELNIGSSGSLYFHDGSDSRDSAPIVFPGRATTYSSGNGKGSGSSSRPTKAQSRSNPSGSNSGRGSINSFGNGGPWPAINLNPNEKRLVDGWHKLNALRQKSKSIQQQQQDNSQDGGRKSSIASDTSSDAKIISILNINEAPRCAQKNGYCDEIDGYPRSFFNQILNKTLNLTPTEFQNTFGETIDNNSVFTDVEYSLRDGFDETPLCSVREHTIYPKAAQNRQGKFMYIVNHDEYLQGIRVETCRTEKSSCMFTEGHLPGYTSTCKQKYIYKKLLAFSPDGKPMPDSFRLPSCCVCYVKSMFISDRINPAVDLSGGANADIQPTVATDDDYWSSHPSSSTISYPTHDDDDIHRHHDGFSSSTEPGSSSLGSITFPSTSSHDDDLSTYQVPSPTTSTLRTNLDGGGGSGGTASADNNNNGGQLQNNNKAENQTASRRLRLK